METSTQLLVPADGYAGGAFDVVITLSEKPAAFAAAQVGVDKGTPGEPVYLGPAGIPVEDPDTDDYVSTIPATGTDMMHHQYRVTITPKAEDGDLVVKVNEFVDQVKGTRSHWKPQVKMQLCPSYAANEVKAATANKYTPAAGLSEGVTKLTIKIKLASVAA